MANTPFEDIQMNDLIVEVRMEDDIRYKGLIEDFSSDAVSVSFESSDLQPRQVNYDQVYVIDESSEQTPVYEANTECEVYSQKNNQGPFGWRPAQIKMVRGAFYMFNFTTGDLSADVAEIDKLRLKSEQPSLRPDTIFKFSASVHNQLLDFVSDMKSHIELKKFLSPAKITFDAETNELIVITTSNHVLSRTKMMMDLHLKFLDTKSTLSRRIKSAEQQLETLMHPKNNKKDVNAKFTEEFTVKESLMGLAIGTSGNNIMQARHMPGIISIEVDDQKVFHIYAETKRAAEDARRILEFDERMISIPRSKIGRIIGNRGSTMQEMVDRSGVLRVKVEGDQLHDNEECVPIVLTGTVESITNMSMIVNYYLSHIETIDNLIAEARTKSGQQDNVSLPQHQLQSTQS